MTTQEDWKDTVEIPTSGFLCFIPWLRLNRWVAVKGFKFIRYPDPSCGVPKIPFLDLLFSSYRNHYGKPIADVTLVIKEESPIGWNISEEDYSEVKTLSKMLFLCGVSAMEFYNPMSSYCCSSQFALIGQRFQNQMDGPALTMRRKDGTTTSVGPTFEQLHFINPPHYRTNHEVELAMDLFISLSQLYLGNSELKARVQAAIDLFYLACSDSNDITEETEVVLMASAFEQLLDCDGKSREVALKLCELFSAYSTLTVENALLTRKTIPVEDRYRESQLKWPLHKFWMKDFYDLRSNIVHGNERSTWKHGWTVTEHLTFATYIFPLAVKLLLRQENLISMTAQDLVDCKTADQILESLDWHELLDGSTNARFNVIRRGEDQSIRLIIEQLKTMDFSEGK